MFVITVACPLFTSLMPYALASQGGGRRPLYAELSSAKDVS